MSHQESLLAQSPMQRRRSPRRLLLSFLGEFLVQEGQATVKARAVIQAFEGAGIKPPATRAALERFVNQGLLSREKRGREVQYSLTGRGEKILLDAQRRVQSDAPFEPVGEGWSIVLFSLAAESQPVRHRLRSILAWEGFAPFGRGAWVAPGEVNFVTLREAVESQVQSDAIVAFRSSVAEGFSMGVSVPSVWSVHTIEAAHLEFADMWGSGEMGGSIDNESPLALRTMLVSDWLELLRADPRLPSEHLPRYWPARSSLGLFRSWQSRLRAPSIDELNECNG